jgi:hypothetical protein
MGETYTLRCPKPPAAARRAHRRAGKNARQFAQRRDEGVWEAGRPAVEFEQEGPVVVRAHQRNVVDPLIQMHRKLVETPAGDKDSQCEGVVARGWRW